MRASAGAGAALLLDPRIVLPRQKPMIVRTIPSTGEKIPAVGLGSSQTFNVGASAEERAPIREVIRLFSEMGGKLIDTAPSYRRSEGVIGDLVAELGTRDRLFLATKVRKEGREEGIAEIETSFERLHTDTLDLIQVHNLRDTPTQLATLRELKQQGRIRYVGVTTSSLRQFEAMEQVLSTEELDFVQLNYNIGSRQAEERLLPLAKERGIAVLVNLPYGRGRMFRAVGDAKLPEWAAAFDCESWGQFFLKFIISHPAVTCPIPATSNPRHLVDNMGAMYGRLPDEAMRKRMVEYFERVSGQHARS